MKTIMHLPAPDGGGRVETGPVQFGDDWPGVFVRGDNAAYYAVLLHTLITSGGENATTDKLARGFLIGLYDVLRSATIGPAAEMMPNIGPQDVGGGGA